MISKMTAYSPIMRLKVTNEYAEKSKQTVGMSLMNYLNEVVLSVNINKLDGHGKVCSEEKYGAESLLDQKHDFHLPNLNHVDINDLIKMREEYCKNPSLRYLNINSLRNKIVSLRVPIDVYIKVPIDILCIDETKLGDSFPDSQFLNGNYKFPRFRRDRNSKGGGNIVYLRQGLISKRLKNFE